MSHDWDALRRLSKVYRSPMDDFGWTPWSCEYSGPNGRYSIVLHGSDPEQVWRDNCTQLDDLVILGIHWNTFPVKHDDTTGQIND